MDSCLWFFSLLLDSTKLSKLVYFLISSFTYFHRQPSAPLLRFWITLGAVVIIWPLRGAAESIHCAVLFCSAQFPGVLAYCMSKSAIDQFTRCTALGEYTLGFSPPSLCPCSVLKVTPSVILKMNLFQNWRVSRSEWTPCGECFSFRK